MLCWAHYFIMYSNKQGKCKFSFFSFAKLIEIFVDMVWQPWHKLVTKKRKENYQLCCFEKQKLNTVTEQTTNGKFWSAEEIPTICSWNVHFSNVVSGYWSVLLTLSDYWLINVNTVQTVHSGPQCRRCLVKVHLLPGLNGHVQITMPFETPGAVSYFQKRQS